MRSLGMVRKIDELGRIVLPIETRRLMDLQAGDGVEIFSKKDRVILQKYAPACIFCGEAEDVITYKNKRVCRNCAKELCRIEQ